MKPTQNTLGRGLKSLIGESKIQDTSYIPDLDIDEIIPNSYQPRMYINEDSLNDLAKSIKESGVIEPLIVTRTNNGKYELIAGERRWRASKLAGKENVPVVVKEASPQQMLELAIVENVQRADLNPLEEAQAFQHLVDDFGLTPSQIAVKVGFSGSLVSNKMRLLTLPEPIKKTLMEGKITEGHARALLGVRDNSTMRLAHDKVIASNLSVRATEELVRRMNIGFAPKGNARTRIVDEVTSNYEFSLKEHLSSDKIKLSRSKKGGKIEIRFKSDEELSELIHKMGIK